ncbi:hypothetical protein RRG08_061886 [Elysia crispata]|uniref:Uncharacterized protein n=1 Tax=Elysia crispata TaxID=231223 RepID=A0AAE1CIM7_9GAST|nr:hypothetical protein RRG08_061886 [Elysia crispata]
MLVSPSEHAASPTLDCHTTPRVRYELRSLSSFINSFTTETDVQPHPSSNEQLMAISPNHKQNTAHALQTRVTWY